MDDNAAAGTSGPVPRKPFAGHELNEFAWSVLDALPTGVVVCEAAAAGLQVVYHNPRFSKLLQLPDDIVAGASLVSLLEDGLDEVGVAALKAPPEQVDVRLETPAGLRATLRLAAHPTASNYWIGSVERASASQESARGIVESMIDASRNLVAAKDLDGRYISINSAYAEFFGQPREAILGLSREQFAALREGRPGPATASLSLAEAEVVSSGRPAVLRGVRLQDGAGRERVVDVVYTPVMGDGREVRFLIAVASDVTETEVFRQRYEVQTEFLVQLMDAIPEPIWVCDADGNWEQNNLALEQLVGESGNSGRGYDFFDDERVARQMRAADKRVVIYNKRELLENVPATDSQGQDLWLDVLKVPLDVRGEAARRVVSVGHDVTRRHRSEAAQREQLRSARFVAKVSSLFVSQPPERIDEQLTTALSEVAEYAGAFRCIVRELPRPDGMPSRTAEWRADGIMGELADTAPWELNWLMGELEENGYVLCPSVGELPPAAAEEATICRREGINAFIAAPLTLNGGNRGILFVNCLRSNPAWTEATADSICVCANILAAAIDRAASERRLAQASRQLREIATSIPGAIFQWEISQRRLRLNYVSEGIAALTELDFADVIADPERVSKLVDADSRRLALRRALAAAETLEPFQMEVPVNLPRSGNRRWLKLSVSARRAKHGRVLLDGLINDVTDVKLHEQALLAARNQLESVTRSIPGMVYQARYTVGSPEPTLLFASRGTKDVFGIDANTIMSNAGLLRRMVLVEDVPSLKASLEHAIGELSPWKHEFRIRDAAGQLKWIQGRAVPSQPDEQGGIQFNGMLMDVTDRERTVRRLRDAEDELRDLTASMPGFVFRMDVFEHGRTRLSYLSEGVREIYGMTAEEVLALSNNALSEMVVEEDRDLMEQAVSDALHTGTTVTLERRLIDAMGKEHWLQSLLRPRPSLDGPVSLVGVTLDITERKRAEAALAAAEQRVLEVTQALPGLVYQVHYSAHGEFDWRYLAGRTITGRLVDEQVSDLGTIYAEDQQRILNLFAESAAELTQLEADFRVTMPNGELRWARMSAEPIRAGDGATLFNGFALDITDRKKAEEALRTSEERYRAVVQDQSEIVCRMDAAGEVTFINEAGLRRFGDLKDCLGKAWWELLPPSRRAAAEQKLMALTEAAPADGIELRSNKGDTEPVWHQWRLRAFYSDGVLTGYQAVGRDVTELKSLERQVRSIADREQQRIGHDLHDGLGQELTGLSLLLKGLEHEVASHAPELNTDVKNAQDVLNDSIATARALAQGLSPVHLGRDGLAGALEQLAANVQSIHNVPVVVVNRHGSREVAVPIVTEFYRIAQEAVNNAARHAQATQITIDLNFEAGIRLSVSDDGHGIQDRAGDGMGLRIMSYRADLVGAELTVAEDPNGGTMVVCELTDQGLEGEE